MALKNDLDVVSGMKSFDHRNANGLWLWEGEHRQKCLVEVIDAKHNVNACHSTRKTNSIVCNVIDYELVNREKGEMGIFCEIDKEQDS